MSTVFHNSDDRLTMLLTSTQHRLRAATSSDPPGLLHRDMCLTSTTESAACPQLRACKSNPLTGLESPHKVLHFVLQRLAPDLLQHVCIPSQPGARLLVWDGKQKSCS